MPNMRFSSTLKFSKLMSKELKCYLEINKRCASTAAKNIDEWNTAKPFSAIPGFPSIPFFGTAWVYIPIIGYYKPSRHHQSCMDKRKRFGDVYRDRIGDVECITTCRAEDMPVVVQNEGKFPFRGPLFDCQRLYRESRKDLFNNIGLFLEKGKKWHDLRIRSQNYMLKPKPLESYFPLVQDITRDFIKRLLHLRNKENEVKNLDHEFTRYASEAICCIGLDTRLGLLELDTESNLHTAKVTKCIMDLFDGMNKLEGAYGFIEYWRHFSTPTWRKFEKASDVFHNLAIQLIEDSINNFQNSDNMEMTFLQQLIIKERLDIKDVMVIIFDMLIAGVETTGYGLCFMLYLLAKNPEKQELALKEIKRVLPNKNDKITPETYSQLSYVKACFKETMRLFPLIIGLPRVLARDCVVGGYQVPAGTCVAVSIIDIMKDEKYFENPNTFLPERFIGSQIPINPFSYTPFGFGIRSCVGRRFAEIEVISVIVEIIRNFKVEYHYEDIDILTRIVSVPDKSLRVRFYER